MATNNPTTLITVTYPISSSQTVYVANDATGSLTACVLNSGSYNLRLVNSASSTGAAATPFEVYSEFNRKCGSYFDFSLNTDGRTKITYRGSASGTISFISSAVAKRMLGFAESVVTLSFSSGSVVYSDYQPYGAVFSFGSTNDTSWNRTISKAAYSNSPDGRVFGWKDDYAQFTRKMDLRFHPYDQTIKAATPSNTATPIHQVSKSLWQQPPTLESSTYEGPYTVDHFLFQSPAKECRATIATLQQFIAGTDNKFIVSYVHPETINTEDQYQQSIQNFHKLLDLTNFKLTLNGEGIKAHYTSSVPSTTSFAPSDISNLFAWYKFDNITQSGGAVSQVSDKSGNGRHAVQATVGNRPTYSASGGANNKAYWTNTAASSGGKYLLAGVAADWTFLHNGTGFTVFVVQKNSATDAYYILGTQNGSGGNRGFGLVRLSSTSTRFAIGDGSSQIVGSDFTMTQNSWSKLCVYGDSGADPDYYVRLNGSATSNANESGTPSATVSPYPLGIGVGGGGLYSTDASFHEIIIYNRKLSDMEITQVEVYLNDTYGL